MGSEQVVQKKEGAEEVGRGVAQLIILRAMERLIWGLRGKRLTEALGGMMMCVFV